jgi:hypothetical protein
LKTTAFSLTDIIAALSWPKSWTIKNARTHFAFSLYALVASTFRAKLVTERFSRHLKTPDVLAVEIFHNAMTRKG